MGAESEVNGYDHHNGNTTRTENLTRSETLQSINLTQEQFEKLYLTPPNKVSGDLRRTFANPTPL